MMTRPRSPIRQMLSRLHRESRGAVAMAAMAACMILFMLSLVLWDAGHAVRDKVDLQNAADSAAYSKAAVEARSLNMLSFTNIAKRSVVGLHNTYWGMFIAYAGWVTSRCSACWSCVSLCPCVCSDCYGNLPILGAEAIGDWSAFAGSIGPLPSPIPIGGKSEDVFGEELKALDDYQDYLMEITPWWGWAEQLLRGVRNGATVTASWPPPPDSLTEGTDLLERILRLPFINMSASNTTWQDGLPVAKEHDTIRGTLSTFLPTGVASILNKMAGLLELGGTGMSVTDVVGALRDSFYNMETCSPGVPGISPMTPGSVAEVGANALLHRQRSGSTLSCTGGPSSPRLVVAGALLGSTLCPISAVLPQFREPMGPVYLRDTESIFTGVSGSSTLPSGPRELQRRSSVIFAYKRAPKFQGELDENFEILESDYGASGRSAWANPTLNASGQWALSRSEVVYTNRAGTPESSRFINLGGLTQGVHNTWMWHAGWTAKLRPLAFEGEFEAMASAGHRSYFSSMFHDVLPYLAAGAAISNTLSTSSNIRQLGWDFFYMEKVSKSMDNTTVDGTPQ